MIDKHYLLTVMSSVFVRLIAFGRVSWSIVVLIVGLGTASGQPIVSEVLSPSADPVRCGAQAHW
ncbi:Uncharacterised protein [Mycobacteroides abscessus subsp. abscessus]|uniref:Uncharacterized protein n=1 Tax=Mycobacteroides abscessus TaxID=36809 RepID=A0AB33T0Q6_9MYCO|nr:hypothetical protein [Mycobacteroides abscessus]SHP04929.1 Uncharacterised protein [Mycobacteroides abscessus subsp. abscessus]SKL46914.1 Uncharacterised protein [Mycobacteroides abscessus subsp. massiliense]MBE5450903.1 hypothetical protein [Mycobacteroides abscessus]MBE5467396.1 hypothetical protein [Mycobacteroides abscessus]